MAATVVASAKIVPRGHIGLVERFGRFHHTLQPGLATVIPFVDRVRPIPTGDRILTPAPIHAATSDGGTVAVEPTLHVRVTDPLRAAYEVADFTSALENLCEVTLRSTVGNMQTARALIGRSELTSTLEDALSDAADNWGFTLERVEIATIRQS